AGAHCRARGAGCARAGARGGETAARARARDSMETLTPDICVIGAGAGGLSVAAAAAAFGVPVVLIEKGRMGGECLYTGCVPSKSMIAAARHAESMRSSGLFGIKPVEPEVAFDEVSDHIHRVIAEIAPNDTKERFTGL